MSCSKHDIEVCLLFWQRGKSICWFMFHCNCIDRWGFSRRLGNQQMQGKWFRHFVDAGWSPSTSINWESLLELKKRSCFFQWRWLGIPSWKLTYPLTRDFWTWFSFSLRGICYFPGSTSLRNSAWMQQRVRSHVTVPRYVYPVFEAVDASWNIFMSIESYLYTYISNIWLHSYTYVHCNTVYA